MLFNKKKPNYIIELIVYLILFLIIIIILYNNNNYNNNNNNNITNYKHNRELLSVNKSCINGIISVNKTCICNSYYITYKLNNEYCNYKQKSALTAYLLEIFLGLFGGGYFYVGLTSIGGLQLFFTLLLTSSCICSLPLIATSSNVMRYLILYMNIISLILLLFWWIYASILFKSLNINDNNDVMLYNDI
jgi:hypothetical protein